jgi:hypothetical protein
MATTKMGILEVGADYVKVLLVSPKGDHSIVEVASMKFPQGISPVPGQVLEVDWMGRFFSVIGKTADRVYSFSVDLPATVTVDAAAIGTDEEAAKTSAINAIKKMGDVRRLKFPYDIMVNK